MTGIGELIIMGQILMWGLLNLSLDLLPLTGAVGQPLADCRGRSFGLTQFWVQWGCDGLNHGVARQICLH